MGIFTVDRKTEIKIRVIRDVEREKEEKEEKDTIKRERGGGRR